MAEGEGSSRGYEDPKENIGCDGYVHSLDCGHGFTGVYKCYIIILCISYCVSIISTVILKTITKNKNMNKNKQVHKNKVFE